MNKLGLSLSVLSLCWFINIDGWAGTFYSGQPQSPPKPPEPTVVSSSCVQKITTTASNGQVTTTEASCQDHPSVPQGGSCVQKTTTTYSDGQVTTTEGSCPS
jgi:hypothetical protein